MAHKKAGGSSRNGRDSAVCRLGLKKFGGQEAVEGNILVRDGHLAAVIDWGAAGRGDRAIELNAVAVAANRRAFAWGRLAAHDMRAINALVTPAAMPVPVLDTDLDALVAVRAIPGDEMPDEPLFGAIARSGPPRHIDWRARPA